MSHPLEHSRIGLLACSCASIANMHYQDESSVRRVGRLLHYRLGRLPDIACSITYSAGVARSRVARIKEDPLLQHEEPPLGVEGDGLNRDQDRLHPENSHLNLRIVVAARTVRRATRLSPSPGLPSVTSFSAPPRNSRERLLVDALALSGLTVLVDCSGFRFPLSQPPVP